MIIIGRILTKYKQCSKGYLVHKNIFIMKKLLAVVALALITLTMSAQEDYKITVKAGVGLSSLVMQTLNFLLLTKWVSHMI